MTLRRSAIAAWQNHGVDAVRGTKPYNTGRGNVGLVQ
jgi:hypothetical protein